MEATLEDLRGENRQLRGRLQDLTDEAGKNETISRRFQSIELSLLSAPSLPELLHRLVEGVAGTLVLDDVSLVLHDRDHGGHSRKAECLRVNCSAGRSVRIRSVE